MTFQGRQIDENGWFREAVECPFGFPALQIVRAGQLDGFFISVLMHESDMSTILDRTGTEGGTGIERKFFSAGQLDICVGTVFLEERMFGVM